MVTGCDKLMVDLLYYHIMSIIFLLSLYFLSASSLLSVQFLLIFWVILLRISQYIIILQTQQRLTSRLC